MRVLRFRQVLAVGRYLTIREAAASSEQAPQTGKGEASVSACKEK
jgi:hypothetical protein